MRSAEAQYEAQESSRGDVIKLANGLQTSLFATKNSIEEAYEYAYSIIETLDSKDKAGVITAMQVLINTIAEEVKRKAEWR
jgi:hypothetical protein